jgi:hypothetical protein
VTAQAVNQVAPRIYEIRPGLILKIDSGFFYARIMSRAGVSALTSGECRIQRAGEEISAPVYPERRNSQTEIRTGGLSKCIVIVP